MKVAVLDVGKTNVKAVIVDAETEARDRSPHQAQPGPDRRSLSAFRRRRRSSRSFCIRLNELHAEFGFDAISITAHGASGALLREDGLALPVLDYEFRYPAEIEAAYDAIRPPFSETFSPRLPGGLNLGAQLHYQKTAFPKPLRRCGPSSPIRNTGAGG